MSTTTWTPPKWSWRDYLDYIRQGFWTWLFGWVIGLHGIIVLLPSAFFAFIIMGPVDGIWAAALRITLYSLIASTVCLLLTGAKWSWMNSFFGSMLPAGFIIGLVIELLLTLVMGVIRVGTLILGGTQLAQPPFAFADAFSILVIGIAAVWGALETRPSA